MTKYKLIKEYPGSPELGTVAEKESKIKSNTSYYYSDGDKEEAEEFIIDNKPCLSYTDIMWNFKENTKKNILSIDKDLLIEIIKLKL